MTYLDGIVAWHRKRAATDPRDATALIERAADERTTAPRRFANALTAGPSLAVIAEIKRRSPSKGEIDESLDPILLAKEYEQGGAACLSVLTDTPHFGGSANDLKAARSATRLPVLRKDFTVSELDVIDAALMGADAVLLIVAALSDAELRSFSSLAMQLSLDALVEVHDEVELDRALSVDVKLIGVNQRNLHTFEVDQDRAERMMTRIPTGVVAVAESGIRSSEDARRLAAAGYRAVLVGEHLVRSSDRGKALRELRVALPS
ncbi:MAG: indole-3-glycerol phosphate synthase TrpC [Ilumatobacteraceae bacterium]